MSFKENNYTVIRNIISPELANFVSHYFQMKRQVARTMFDTRYISQFNEDWGRWNDQQVPETYSHYADIVMETLLEKVKPEMEKQSDIKLIPTYSYARIYKKGDVLKRHKDRYSCEISTTLNLGGDPWPIYLEPSGEVNKEGVKVDLNPGDMLMYRGCELEHWREKFDGNMCAQVFLHYNDASGYNKYNTTAWEGDIDAKNNIYDSRPHLGLPSYFKGMKIEFEDEDTTS